MNTTLPKISGDWLNSSQSVALMAMFARKGYTARFVGGVVRNALLGEQVNDLDIATDALPDKVMEMSQNAGFKAIATGLDHGTVTVIVEGQVYEITTLRIDVQSHGRHAQVAFTSDWLVDAQRRDFTMNALYVGADGALFDPLNGYEDLMARRVRFISNADDRISEDYLRILRFFRFSAQYGRGEVDREGLAACVRLQQGLGLLSRERIRSEFMRLLLMPRVAEVIDIIFSHGLLLPLTARVPHMARFKKWLQLESVLKRKPCAINRLGALNMLVLEDADALANCLRFSNQEKRSLTQWGIQHRINQQITEKQARSMLFKLGKDYQVTIAINWLLSGSASKDPQWRNLYDLPDRWHCPDFPIKGQDLVERGMAPGPAVGKKMKECQQQWINSDFTLTRNELLNQLDIKQ